jgi:fumarate reductase flavoprotein subunit
MTKYSFEIAPVPIPASEIQDTINTEVAVIGAGNAGMVAAISAAEASARTVILQKQAAFTTQARHIAAINTSLQKALSVRINRDEVIAEICRWGAMSIDQRVVSVWADRSGEMFDWLRNILEAHDLQTWLETDVKEGFYKSYPVTHRFGTIPTRFYSEHMRPLGEKALALGVDIHYSTPAIQLIREGNGRVTGVIAKSKTRGYIQFNTSKAIILCAGGYQNDASMMQAYCPRGYYYSVQGAGSGRTGDGIKMGIWVGAAIDPLPHAPMQFDSGLLKGSIESGFLGAGTMGWRQPFLHVNIYGERYSNEDQPYAYNCNAAVLQPGHVWWKVWDNNWPEDIRRFHTTVCARIVPHPMASMNRSCMRDMTNMEEEQNAAIEAQRIQNEKLVGSGFLQKADTIEELGGKMGVPVATFKATVRRYNKMVKSGKDLDFGKLPFRMSTIESPPFYAGKFGAAMLSTLNGLRINTRMQVLDTDLKVIPGLYSAGDNSGNFFANDYPQLLGGLALGRAFTFAYLAGKNAAEE